MQRLEIVVTLMLARERRATADASAGCTPLVVALTGLPSLPLEMIAEAAAAVGYADV